MNHPEYFVAFEDHRASTLGKFAEHLRAMPKKVVGTVQLSELCAMADHPNGLYLFFDDQDELWYVGKSTSRSFIERVPSKYEEHSCQKLAVEISHWHGVRINLLSLKSRELSRATFKPSGSATDKATESKHPNSQM